MGTPLYDAIISLGRSMRDIYDGMWTRGRVGTIAGSKCAVGLVTYHNGFVPGHTYESPARGVLVAAEALVKALTEDQRERVLAAAKDIDGGEGADPVLERYVTLAFAGAPLSVNLHEWTQAIDSTVVMANDKVMRDEEEAYEWFSAAQNLLAKDLLPPAPVMSEAETKEWLWSQAPDQVRERLGEDEYEYLRMEAKLDAAEGR